jgi:hypothetical protein
VTAPLRIPRVSAEGALAEPPTASTANARSPHIVDWYAAYKDAGFEVIGVHTPEYAFERVRANVASGAKDLGISYPIALDPNYSTWTNYRNRYWPATYLIDANGTIRHI